MVENDRQTPPRVLLCKSGLEEHDRGVRYVTRNLVEAGFEVVYIVFHAPDEVARIAVQEDVDVIGISSSAGGHLAVVEQVQKDLQNLGANDIRIVVGGIIPEADHPKLLDDLGVTAIFGPGSSTEPIIGTIRQAARDRQREVATG